MTGPLPDDTRGIVDPVAMLRHVDFGREPAGENLDGVIEWFWSVAWNLPDGVTHDQQILGHPAGNVSIGTIDETDTCVDPPEGRLYGVMTGVGHRRLTATGWTVAGRTVVGGLGVLLGAPARAVTDGQFGLAEAMPGLDGLGLVAAVCAEADNAARIAVLRARLEEFVSWQPEKLLAEAREVGAVAAIAEQDRTVTRVEQLARAAGVSVRSLQRLFDVHVGVGPAFVIRRWRIIEAAEAARAAIDLGDWRGWAVVAAELGYADQAHLSRDFRQHLGVSPSSYLSTSSRGVD